MDASLDQFLRKKFETNLLVKYIFQIEHHWPWYQLAIVQFVSCSLRWCSRDFCYLFSRSGIVRGPVIKNIFFIFEVWRKMSTSRIGHRLSEFFPPSQNSQSRMSQSRTGLEGKWKSIFGHRFFLSFLNHHHQVFDHLQVVNFTGMVPVQVNRLRVFISSYQSLIRTGYSRIFCDIGSLY